MKLKILSVCGQTVASYDEEADQSCKIKYSNCMLHHLSCRNAVLSLHQTMGGIVSQEWHFHLFYLENPNS